MRTLLLVLSLLGSLRLGEAQTPDEFARSVRPILTENCSTCHNATKARGPVNFLKAETAVDVESQRGIWHNVATQLRNRTMPPVASKLTEQDRLFVSTWIDQHLRQSACNGSDYAGTVTLRRLNRREYRNSIRDLLGVDFDVSQLFPEDGSGGEGFDTDGETLYVPPLLMERYLQAGQQILARTIITPPLARGFSGSDLRPSEGAGTVHGNRRLLAPGEEVSASLAAYTNDTYTFAVTVARSTTSPLTFVLKVDGSEIGSITVPRYEAPGATGGSKTMQLNRGGHTISLQAKGLPVEIIRVQISQKQDQEPPAERRAIHYRLVGMEPGDSPLESRKSAEHTLAAFARKAYRRPLQPGDLEPLMKLYDRAAERGDPFEERIRLALEAVLISPKFLFRIEEAPDAPGIKPLSEHELATRLSYFLWSTTPDEELTRLADNGLLRDTKVLSTQVDRLLADPRSRVFATTFIGQWLGTKDVGFRVVPAYTDLQDFYTPEVAADLRAEPVLMFSYMLANNRPLLDLLDANYGFLTERLVKFYQLEAKIKIQGDDFQRVEWPDDRRGGVLGMAAMLAMTSHYKQTSPVLRGAWVLDTLLGTTVPPPPPDVPPLEASAKKEEVLTVREKLTRHRANASCNTCHKLIDPIGFGLENFDWMGRWRDTENEHPVDASAVLPSGEKFNGPVELRQAMLKQKDEYLRNVTRKVLGYALGRSLQDGDECTVQRIMQAVQKDNFGAKTLVREIVLSLPFRNSQRDAGPLTSAAPPRKRTVNQERPQ